MAIMALPRLALALVRDKPAGVSERELRHALDVGWQIDTMAMRYAPVGAGSYHWVVRDSLDRQWFVTVDDLDDKGWLGASRPVVSRGLQAAMDTAFALRHREGLRFVVAPVQALGGATVLPLGSKYTIAVFPFVYGASGRFGEPPSAEELGQMTDMLAALHRSTPLTALASRFPVNVPERGALETALRELGQPWRGGPFSEPARALIADTAGRLRQVLATFDRLTERVKALEPVITHGEPHLANIMRAGSDMMLIDWDTVGLAPPERDLWMVASDDGEATRRYTEATGRAVDPAALALYRIRWALDDISIDVRLFRARHRRTEGTEFAWRILEDTLKDEAWSAQGLV
jgi:spectinomycin phosphotransferase